MVIAAFDKETPFILAVFGCQYHGESPDSTKTALIDQFQNLIEGGQPKFVEALEHEDLTPTGGSSRIWMSYWQTPASYETWWTSSAVANFWSSLPDDAGFWREKLQFHAIRSMHETNQQVRNSFLHVAEMAELPPGAGGFWGSYRKRLDPNDPMKTAISPYLPAKEVTDEIIPGRVLVECVPDNLCCAIEGQDYTNVMPEEWKYWEENLDDLANAWTQICVTASNEDGLVSGRMLHSPSSGFINRTKSSKVWPEAADYNRKMQLLYFLDMGWMEKIGRRYKIHRDLRRGFMDAYKPDGPMKDGKFVVWVDFGTFKASDVEAEYVGCYEGTGFMPYAEHPAFKKDSAARL